MADAYEEDILDAYISCSSLQLALSASVLIACAVMLKQPAKRAREWNSFSILNHANPFFFASISTRIPQNGFIMISVDQCTRG
jgi:hypothetical protein